MGTEWQFSGDHVPAAWSRAGRRVCACVPLSFYSCRYSAVLLRAFRANGFGILVRDPGTFVYKGGRLWFK
jgi:hypothetical protein